MPCKDREKRMGDLVLCARSHLMGTGPRPPLSMPDHVPLADAGAETLAGGSPVRHYLNGVTSSWVSEVLGAIGGIPSLHAFHDGELSTCPGLAALVRHDGHRKNLSVPGEAGK